MYIGYSLFIDFIFLLIGSQCWFGLILDCKVSQLREEFGDFRVFPLLVVQSLRMYGN